MDIDNTIARVFKRWDDKGNSVSPPKQVFANPDFEFAVTVGGCLVGDADEFHEFQKILAALGECEFGFVQNVGYEHSSKGSSSIKGDNRLFPIGISYEHFMDAMRSIPPDGMGYSFFDFYVFGTNPHWGIYVCEWPTVNIIGSLPNLIERFRQIFKIEGTGRAELPFIEKEYSHRKDHRGYYDEFILNYKL